MDEENKPAEPSSERARKMVGDLDDLVRAVRGSLPATKPWQRQLLDHLADVDRRTQVLRMTLSMSRPAAEVKDAAEQLRVALRVAHRYVATGRADITTRAAVLLACELGLKIDAALA